MEEAVRLVEAPAGDVGRGRRVERGLRAVLDLLVEESREPRAGRLHALAPERRACVLEVRLDETRMRDDADQVERMLARAAVELEREQHARELRLDIGHPRVVLLLALEVVEADLPAAVRAARHRDDARARPREQRGEELGSQGEVAEVVRAELELEPVGGRASLRDAHDPRVVDQHVDRLVPVEQPVGERTHRGQVGEVEVVELDRAAGRAARDLGLRRAGTLGAARRREHAGALAGERDRALQPEADVPAGDDDEPPGLVRDVVARPG